MSQRFLTRSAVAAIAAGLAVAAPAAAAPTADSGATGARAVGVYAPTASPAGQPMVHWLAGWWRWTMGQPLTHNASVDPDGRFCATHQNAPIWYLGSVFDGSSTTRSCTIPSGMPVLIHLSSFLADYPCPDPNYGPKPGETLKHFLTREAAKGVMDDPMDMLTVTVDGRAVSGIRRYHYATGMFTFTGDKSMAAADPCITGKPQQGVANGYLTMVRPLSPGKHTVVIRAMDMGMGEQVLTYKLTAVG